MRKLLDHSFDDRPENRRGNEQRRKPPEPDPRAWHDGVRRVNGAEAILEGGAVASLPLGPEVEAWAVRDASGRVRGIGLFQANAISVERAHRSPEILHEEGDVFQTVASD
jgi:hypothetical protein